MAKVFLTPLFAKLLTGLNLPTQDSDAASKAYVDTKTADIEYTAVCPASSVTELARIPAVNMSSLLSIIDITPASGVGESFHSFIKPIGGIVNDTCFARIGNVQYIEVTFFLSGTDIVVSVINTDTTNNVITNMRIV